MASTFFIPLRAAQQNLARWTRNPSSFQLGHSATLFYRRPREAQPVNTNGCVQTTFHNRPLNGQVTGIPEGLATCGERW